MAGETVVFTPIDAVWAKLDASPSVMMELKEYFSFEIANARHNPLVKKGLWDGMIRLVKRNKIYRGLANEIYAFCKHRNYKYEVDDGPRYPISNVRDETLESFLADLGLPSDMEIRDYQLSVLKEAAFVTRRLFLSPTSSGKSLMIYTLIKWHKERTLIIVPTTSLVHQLAGDFRDYGEKGEIHKIESGVERWSSANIVVSTWQSAIKMVGTDWFDQFGMVIGDEAHKFAAKSLTTIMEAMPNCYLRYGFTGSLDESKCNAMILEGLFGPVMKVITTKELMNRGVVSSINIDVIILKHPEYVRRLKLRYADEMTYLYTLRKRNDFIVRLADTLQGNTLILFYKIEHGKEIARLLAEKANREAYFVDGSVDGEDRNEVRALVEKEDNAIIVASYGTFSTGINIKRLHNVILASAWKSRVLNLQSIGRGLRKGSDKSELNFFDIADDMSWKGRKNFSLLHAEKRIRLYAEEDFQYHLNKIVL